MILALSLHLAPPTPPPQVGKPNELMPQCVLDFYVAERRQREGWGSRLFKHMLVQERADPRWGQQQEQINVLQLQIIEWAALELVAFEFVIKACKLHGKLRFDYWVKTQLRLDDCHYSKQVTHLK